MTAMKIPNETEQPYTYNKWKEMDLLNANDIERVLMLELNEIAKVHRFLYSEVWWNSEDMRKFVRDVAQKIEKVCENEK